MFFVADYDAVCAIMTTSLPSLPLSHPFTLSLFRSFFRLAYLPPCRVHALCPLIPVLSLFFFFLLPPIFKRFPLPSLRLDPSPSRFDWTPRLLSGRKVCSCLSPSDVYPGLVELLSRRVSTSVELYAGYG